MKDIILILSIILVLLIIYLVVRKDKDEKDGKNEENKQDENEESKQDDDEQNEDESEDESEDEQDEQNEDDNLNKKVTFKMDILDDEIHKKLDDTRYNNGRNSGGVYRMKHNYINTKNKKYVVPEKYLDYTIIDGKNYTLGYPSTFAGCKLF